MKSLLGKKVWVAGATGMVGSALVRQLKQLDCVVLAPSRKELDLSNQQEVLAWVKKNKPDNVFIAAAKVGGILANRDFPYQFLYNNLIIECNIINACILANVPRVCFLGSSCIYPKDAPQPIRESYLLSGTLESTNEWYAIAKISGIKLCQAAKKEYGLSYMSAMPCNLYGVGDNFDLASSHVLPALIHKIHLAKLSKSEEVTLWGTGKACREFLYADDCADALIHAMQHYDGDVINIGTGREISILELAKLIAEVIGWNGEFIFDETKPDGVMHKVMDISQLNAMGWEPKTDLRRGIGESYQWFLNNIEGRKV